MAEKRDQILETEAGEDINTNNTEDNGSRLRFYMLTVGLMAVVLILALDNYIICNTLLTPV